MIGKVIALCAEEKEFFQTFGMFQEVHAIKSCFVAIFVFEDHCMWAKCDFLFLSLPKGKFLVKITHSWN